MNNLSKVLIIKISATVLVWCIPLIFFPGSILNFLGLPAQESYMFIRLLGWAYLSLCVGYWFAFKESLKGNILTGPIYVGIVSNGGACAYLLYYGLCGEWQEWGLMFQVIGWGSAFVTALITVGLYKFGISSRALS